MTDNIKLIGVNPTDQPIDLSQALSVQNQTIRHSDGSFMGYSCDPHFDIEKPPEISPSQLMQELKAMVTGLLNKQTNAVNNTLVDTLQTLANNVNPVLNDHEQKIEEQGKYIHILETVLGSFIRLWLVADTMKEDELSEHQNILMNFLQSTATLTVGPTDAKEESEQNG